jgi:hypothetical protein
MTFGFIDESKYEGEMIWHPVQFRYMFAITLDDVKVNGQSLGLCAPNKKCTATVDTGTSHLSMPKFAIDKIRGKVPLREQGVPCLNSE